MGATRAGVLLVCFDGADQAARKRGKVTAQLQAAGARVWDTTVVRRQPRGKASVYDPRRVSIGALTSALTWAVFGLVSGGWVSLVISGVLGAVWGGWQAVAHAHRLTAAQLTHAATRLPAGSSALMIFTETSNSHSLLEAVRPAGPTVASAALIDGAWDATVVTTEDAAATASGDEPCGVFLSYGELADAADIARRLAADTHASQSIRVELVIEIDRTGRRHVKDPMLGAAAVARYNARSWTVLGLVCGGIAGLTGDQGLTGFLGDGVITGVAWGLFGAAAGALYGLWVGRAVSARRLNGLTPLLVPNTSTLVAWADATPDVQTLATAGGGSVVGRLILSFVSTPGGVVLATGRTR